MKTLLRYPSFYLTAPMLASCLLTLVSFRLPVNYLPGVYLLAGVSAVFIVVDCVLQIRLPSGNTFAAMQFVGTREGLVAVAFGLAVIAFCLIDVTLFPIPLIVDPSSYATLEDGRVPIRHISYMSWTLPPIALLCLQNKTLRYLFVTVGFVFPILVIDRNRLFAAMFSTLVILAIRKKSPAALPWATIVLLGTIVAATFSVLGIIRTGSLDFLPLPFSDLFQNSPQALKWLLLYATAGIYNFVAIFAKDYHNADFLLNQLVPLRGSVATLGTDIPLDAETINVGTEYFPFLMALGWLGVLCAILALYTMLLWSVALLRWRITPFLMLIFLRMAYVCVMAPFAPQAFTWSSFAFVLLCLLCHCFAIILPAAAPRYR